MTDFLTLVAAVMIGLWLYDWLDRKV